MLMFQFPVSWQPHAGETSVCEVSGAEADGTPRPGAVIATYDTPRLAAEAAIRLADERGCKIWMPSRDELNLTKHGEPGSAYEKPSQLQRALRERAANGSL